MPDGSVAPRRVPVDERINVHLFENSDGWHLALKKEGRAESFIWFPNEEICRRVHGVWWYFRYGSFAPPIEGKYAGMEYSEAQAQALPFIETLLYAMAVLSDERWRALSKGRRDTYSARQDLKLVEGDIKPIFELLQERGNEIGLLVGEDMPAAALHMLTHIVDKTPLYATSLIEDARAERKLL